MSATGQSSRPSDGVRAGCPNYGYGDIVDLQHKLVTETLGIKHLRAILGMSMGGMNAWQWAEAYPDAMDGVMPVVSLPIKVSGRNMLWRRMVIKVFALNFADDAFDPEELHVLERLMPRVAHGRFFVQPGSETSFGHLIMAHPELGAQHVGEFMRWLGDAPPQANR